MRRYPARDHTQPAAQPPHLEDLRPWRLKPQVQSPHPVPWFWTVGFDGRIQSRGLKPELGRKRARFSRQHGASAAGNNGMALRPKPVILATPQLSPMSNPHRLQRLCQQLPLKASAMPGWTRDDEAQAAGAFGLCSVLLWSPHDLDSRDARCSRPRKPLF
ncbi:hypothetical protein VTK26DRAFT_6068 [Humicola hyalothermophila]